jgi:hypothetical protein
VDIEDRDIPMDRRILQAATWTGLALSAASALAAYEFWRRLIVYRQNGRLPLVFL